MRAVLSILLVAWSLAGCGPASTDTTSPPPQPTATPTAPRVDGVVPARVSVEGGEAGTVYGARFCTEAVLSLGGALVPIDTKSTTSLTFHFPPAADLHVVSTEAATVTCGDQSSTLAAAVIRDPALVVKPKVVSYAPAGPVSTLRPTLEVTFNRSMDPASLDGAVGIEGVDGEVGWNADTFTATFTPTAPLVNDTTYEGFVHGGEAGARSAFGDPIPGDVRWLFHACSGCGPSLP